MLRCKAAPESQKDAQDAGKQASISLGAANSTAARGHGGGVGGEVNLPLERSSTPTQGSTDFIGYAILL